MTHEEAIALQPRFLEGEELSDEVLDNFIAHFMKEPCEVCEASRQSINERKSWRPRSIREFEALIIAAAVLREDDF